MPPGRQSGVEPPQSTFGVARLRQVDMSERMRKMRPMGIADILDETVELYKTSFVLLVGIAAIIHVPYAILERYVLMEQMTAVTAASTSANPETSIRAAFGMLVTAAIVYGYLLITAPIITGALTYAISERYLDRKVTILGSFKRVLTASILGRLLLAIIVKTIAVAAPLIVAAVGIAITAIVTMTGASDSGLNLVLASTTVLFGLAGVFAAVYLGLRLALLEVTIVVEGRGFGHAVARAWTMMHGSMLKCLALFVIAGLVTTLVTWVCTSPTQQLLMASALTGGRTSRAVLILHTAIGAIASTVLAPVMSIVAILLYYDIRIRNEGFDLELLAAELDARTASWAASALPQERPAVQPAPEPPEPPDVESRPQ